MKNVANRSFWGRVAIASIFLIAGVNFSYSLFFRDNPLFGIPFLAEILISLVAALFGYFLVPTYFMIIKVWVESVIMATTSRALSDFWAQYNKKVEESRQLKENAAFEKFKAQIAGGTLLDTSVLIDGRIVALLETGFMSSSIIVPYFVVQELHALADSKDDVKRKKGRRGLDFLNSMKKHKSVVLVKKDFKEVSGVDAGLIDLAQEHSLSLMTLDFNLNKVAKVSNIAVLNLNELTEALKPAFIPGDQLVVHISQEGKEKKQGIGYLPDGTMVVVAKASELIGQEVAVTVSKLIQTEAGKMVFCKLS